MCIITTGNCQEPLQGSKKVSAEICGEYPTYGWVYGLVGEWVDGWGHVRSLKIE